MNHQHNPFANPEFARHYASTTALAVPGHQDLLTLTSVLLQSHLPSVATILVLGAGGGLEINTMARLQAQWCFIGIDPSAPMLAQAARYNDAYQSRLQLYQGEIDSAPEQQQDGACCLLTLHFLNAAKRLATLRQLRRRLRRGAPLVIAHYSVAEHQRQQYFDYYSAYKVAQGADAAQVKRSIAAMLQQLSILSPEQDEQQLREAGFSQPQPFYQGLVFRGWLAFAD